MKRLQPLFSITGLMLCTVLLGGADGCTITIGGDGDGDGDGDDVGDGDGDGDDVGDGDGDQAECYADSDCADGQFCALPDCAALCEPNADGVCDPVDCGPGTCLEFDPGPCAAVDCAPGYHCEVQTACTDGADEFRPDGDCDPSTGNCGGGCEEYAACVEDDVPVECYSDYDCAPGQRCEFENGGGGAVPCYDEDGDGQCDDNGLWQQPGRCVEDTDPPACAYVDCGPGYVCQEETVCYPCDCVDADCGACDDACETYPSCVPVGNDECYNLDVDTCEGVAGCHVELVYPPCAQPEPDPNDPTDPAPPPSCEPVEMCVPDYTNPGDGSCAGHCGNIGSNGQCFCDAVCMQYGDCCEDFVDYCEEVIPPGCTSDADCADGEICELREYCYDDFGNETQCYVEGLCMPVTPPDPCNAIDPAVCEEFVGCTLIEVLPPCGVNPDGSEDFMCDPAAQQICVTDYNEPTGCQSDNDCMGGTCQIQEVCLDWCDQTVPDPECCYTEGVCVYETDPPECIQVETPATNPETGHCVIFPTPCDVPAGWVEGC